MNSKDFESIKVWPSFPPSKGDGGFSLTEASSEVAIEIATAFLGDKVAVYSIFLPASVFRNFPHILNRGSGLCFTPDFSEVKLAAGNEGIVVVKVVEGVIALNICYGNMGRTMYLAVGIPEALPKALLEIRRLCTVDLFPTLKDVILPDSLKTEIVDEIKRFLDAQSLYKELGIPWKRGFLLHGPPGNGKTMLIKAVMNEWSLNAIDLKQMLEHHVGTPDAESSAGGICDVHQFWMPQGPKLYYLEDLDKFAPSRSLEHTDFATVPLANLLQVLDGVTSFEGAIIIATANELVGLAAALVDRPGRIDRIFSITLPSSTNLLCYFLYRNFNVNLDGKCALESIAGTLAGARCSMAYASELVTSAISKHRRNHFVYDEIKPILERLLAHHALSDRPHVGQAL